jgi:hypothetical protein
MGVRKLLVTQQRSLKAMTNSISRQGAGCSLEQFITQWPLTQGQAAFIHSEQWKYAETGNIRKSV